jgi:predicted DNA-binding transcriptional regulator YafY
VSLGGSDDPENLILLCKKCHENEHGFAFESIDKIDDNKKRTITNKKVLLIKEAITNEWKIHFQYKRTIENGEYEITDRDVRPIELYRRKYVYLRAFCFLRNEERNFRIANMTEIKIIK